MPFISSYPVPGPTLASHLAHAIRGAGDMARAYRIGDVEVATERETQRRTSAHNGLSRMREIATMRNSAVVLRRPGIGNIQKNQE